jgi:hypothetical protein
MTNETVSGCADMPDAQGLEELKARLEALNARMERAEERLSEMRMALHEERRAASHRHPPTDGERERPSPPSASCRGQDSSRPGR